MLYERNTFYFNRRHALNLLPSVVVPARLSSIKSVSLFIVACQHVDPEHGPPCRQVGRWIEVLSVLQKLTGLRRLHVSFSRDLLPTHIEMGSPYLGPFMELRALSDFVVEIYDDPDHPGQDWHDRFPPDLPFRVVIRGPSEGV